MRKRFASLLLIFVLLFACVPVWAEGQETTDFSAIPFDLPICFSNFNMISVPMMKRTHQEYTTGNMIADSYVFEAKRLGVEDVNVAIVSLGTIRKSVRVGRRAERLPAGLRVSDRKRPAVSDGAGRFAGAAVSGAEIELFRPEYALQHEAHPPGQGDEHRAVAQQRHGGTARARDAVQGVLQSVRGGADRPSERPDEGVYDGDAQR